MASIGFIFGSMGLPEVLMVLVVGLLLFGRRLPEVGRSVGKQFFQMKRSLKDLQSEMAEVEHLTRDAVSEPNEWAKDAVNTWEADVVDDDYDHDYHADDHDDEQAHQDEVGAEDGDAAEGDGVLSPVDEPEGEVVRNETPAGDDVGVDPDADRT